MSGDYTATVRDWSLRFAGVNRKSCRLADVADGLEPGQQHEQVYVFSLGLAPHRVSLVPHAQIQ